MEQLREAIRQLLDGFSVGAMIMKFFAKKNATQTDQKLPKEHKCHSCEWANYHDNKVVCMRIPCVRETRK